MDIGVIFFAPPRMSAQIARSIEEMGFFTLLYPDSQNLAPEVWSQLNLAAQATSKIRIGTGVTNSITRDPAVTACAALTLQVESQGRAVLGLGRGDSSVQRIGKHEDPVESFERYVTTVQQYLAGEVVDRDGFPSRLEWLSRVNAPRVPVEIAATGPRVIEVAARRADGVCLAVGADPEYVGAVLEHARAAACAAGRNPNAVRYGAFVTCVIHADQQVARDAVRGAVAGFARFSAFKGSNLSRLPPPLRRAAGYLRDHYDMRQHMRAGASHTAGISDEFVDWFGIAGSVDKAQARFHQLAALGLDFCYVVPGSADMKPDIAIGTLQSLAREVLPTARGDA